MEGEYAVVTTACASQEEADKLTGLLLTKRLAACVQSFPVRSSYIWKGEICRQQEVLLQIKCRSGLFPQIRQEIYENHSYEVPEILCTPVTDGLKAYFDWMDEVSEKN